MIGASVYLSRHPLPSGVAIQNSGLLVKLEFQIKNNSIFNTSHVIRNLNVFSLAKSDKLTQGISRIFFSFFLKHFNSTATYYVFLNTSQCCFACLQNLCKWFKHVSIDSNIDGCFFSVAYSKGLNSDCSQLAI